MDSNKQIHIKILLKIYKYKYYQNIKKIKILSSALKSYILFSINILTVSILLDLHAKWNGVAKI